jgi:hypothetical protein
MAQDPSGAVKHNQIGSYYGRKAYAFGIEGVDNVVRVW